jgi:hypothetical protein
VDDNGDSQIDEEGDCAPIEEICDDGIDNDLDGQIDEDCPATTDPATEVDSDGDGVPDTKDVCPGYPDVDCIE